MTAITDLTTVANILKKSGDASNAQKEYLADALIFFDPFQLWESIATDPANPTYEEKAEVVLETFRAFVRFHLRRYGEVQGKATHAAAIQAEIDSAQANME